MRVPAVPNCVLLTLDHHANDIAHRSWCANHFLYFWIAVKTNWENGAGMSKAILKFRMTWKISASRSAPACLPSLQRSALIVWAKAIPASMFGWERAVPDNHFTLHANHRKLCSAGCQIHCAERATQMLDSVYKVTSIIGVIARLRRLLSGRYQSSIARLVRK